MFTLVEKIIMATNIVYSSEISYDCANCKHYGQHCGDGVNMWVDACLQGFSLHTTNVCYCEYIMACEQP